MFGHTSMNVAESTLATIQDVSTGHVFGVFGDAINPFAEVFRKDDHKHWKYFGMRHEEAGAFAASAQAKITGKLGVCMGTVGPGAIHLLNGLYDAKMDHAPVLAITGQIPRSEIGSSYHQEVNLDRLFDDVCVYNQTIITPDQMPRIVAHAAKKALAEQSVAHISIPSDIGPATVAHELPHGVYTRHGEYMPCDGDLQQLTELLDSAKRPALMVGWGARGATAEIQALAAALQSPVIHSLKGKTVLCEDDPYWAGGIGLLGTKGGVYAIDHCDVLLLLGTDFPYRQFLPHGAKIAQVDIEPSRLGRRCHLEVGVTGYVKPTVEALAKRVRPRTDTAFLQKTREVAAKYRASLAKQESLVGATAPIHPQAVAAAIDRVTTDETVYTADTGESIVWMARHVQMRGSRDFICCYNHASMANAMPMAIGIQALDRDRPVVAMCGDGGFSMLMGDFITAVTYDLPIKCVVFNNGILGLVKMEMEATGYAAWHEGIDLHNPSFAACGKAMGGEGIRIEDPADLEAGLQRAMEIDGPVVVDVVTNPKELTMPPKIDAAHAWGFSISKIKEAAISVREKL